MPTADLQTIVSLSTVAEPQQKAVNTFRDSSVGNDILQPATLFWPGPEEWGYSPWLWPLQDSNMSN